MTHQKIISLTILLFALQLRAQVLIQEVYYDPEGSDTGAEWIELVNQSPDTYNLFEFLLDADGPNLLLPEYQLDPGDWVVVHTNCEEPDWTESGHIYLQNTSHNLGNTHGFVGLWHPNEEGQVSEFLISYVEWGSPGQTWEGQAIDAGVWYEDEFVPDVASGQSIHWNGGGYGAAFWSADLNPVPGESEEVTQIELLAFGVTQQQEEISVSWVSPFGGAEFQLERCQPDGNWLRIARIAVHENEIRYRWLDRHVQESTRYSYRIKGIDTDGSISFESETLNIQTVSAEGLILHPNYPNPFNGNTQILFDLPEELLVSLEVYSLTGRHLISVIDNEVLPRGRYSRDVQMDKYPSGHYICRLTAGESTRVQLITYVK